MSANSFVDLMDNIPPWLPMGPWTSNLLDEQTITLTRSDNVTILLSTSPQTPSYIRVAIAPNYQAALNLRGTLMALPTMNLNRTPRAIAGDISTRLIQPIDMYTSCQQQTPAPTKATQHATLQAHGRLKISFTSQNGRLVKGQILIRNFSQTTKIRTQMTLDWIALNPAIITMLQQLETLPDPGNIGVLCTINANLKPSQTDTPQTWVIKTITETQPFRDTTKSAAGNEHIDSVASPSC